MVARLVTCQICKKKSESLFAYKVTDENGKNKYYCSKEEFDNYVPPIKMVKCQVCKVKIVKATAHKIINHRGVNDYYCNEEEYNARVFVIEGRLDVRDYVFIEVLNYEKGQVFPTYLNKRLEELMNFYPFGVIKHVFYLNKDTIQYHIRTKNFKTEHQKSKYIMAIIDSNMNDAYEKWKREQEQLQKMESKTIDELIFNDLQEDESNEVITPKSQKKDITIFLDEEDI